MASSPSQFANAGKLQVIPTPTTVLFTQSINNNVTINNMGNTTQNIRQTSTQNGTIQQQMTGGGVMTAPTSIVRLNQPMPMMQQQPQTPGSFVPQTMWTNMPQSPQQQFTLQKQQQLSPVVQYSSVKNEPATPGAIQQQQQQTTFMPTKLVAQPVVRQTIASQQTPTFTESQINDFVSKCRTFLTTLLKLAEKQAPEKLPMVRQCIQDLLDGTIDPESFTQRLHTLYKSQPHMSLVPFFKLALPHMRQIVKNTFGRPITIELLEKLTLPPSSSTTTPNSSVVVNPSLLNQQQQLQQQQSTPIIQQPLYTTVQPQQKINLLQQPQQQPTLIAPTASLLGQHQQQQQQFRPQISIAGIRPLVASLSPSPVLSASNTSLLGGQQQQVQPVTQITIQQHESLLQRSFLSSPTTTTLQQPQIITVNHQPIKTETITSQHSPMTTISSVQQQQQHHIQVQQRTIIKKEDISDEILGNNALLTTSSTAETDDRHARHCANDDRLLPGHVLRRRLDDLVKKDRRWEGGTMTVHDDAVLALISQATQERLKQLIEHVKLIAHHRIDLAMKNDSAYEQTGDVKGQIRFLEDLDRIEKQRKEKLEQEKILRAAKSRAKTNDPEAAKLKQRAKEMQQAQVEEQRQKEANETALAAIGQRKKRKLEESTNHHPHQTTLHANNGSEQISPIQPSPSSAIPAPSSSSGTSKSRPAKRFCRVNLRDLLLIMEQDKYLKRSTILFKALNK